MTRVLTINGVEVREHPLLAGGKRALRFGRGPIHVSPAMMSLLRAAEGDELARLLEAIPVQELPPLPDYRGLCHLPLGPH